MSAGHHYMLQRRCEACFEVKKQTWLLNDRASSTSPLKVLYCTTDMSSLLFLLRRQGHHTSCYEGQLKRERKWDYMWVFREGEGMVNKGQRERFIQRGTTRPTETIAEKLWKIRFGSEEGEAKQEEILDNRQHIWSHWHLSHVTQMLYGTCSPGCQHFSSVLKCTVPRGSYHQQTSCWNMLEQLRRELSISTQPDSHPVVSLEYNPFISRCPQFSPMKACKTLP